MNDATDRCGRMTTTTTVTRRRRRWRSLRALLASNWALAARAVQRWRPAAVARLLGSCPCSPARSTSSWKERASTAPRRARRAYENSRAAHRRPPPAASDTYRLAWTVCGDIFAALCAQLRRAGRSEWARRAAHRLAAFTQDLGGGPLEHGPCAPPSVSHSPRPPASPDPLALHLLPLWARWAAPIRRWSLESTRSAAVVQRRTDELLLDYGVEATDTWWPLGRAKVGRLLLATARWDWASPSADCPQQRTVRVGLSGHRDFAAGHLRSGLSQRSVAGTNWRRLIDSEYRQA